MMLRLLFPVLLTLLLCSSPLFADDSPMWIHVCDDGGAGGYDAFPDVFRLQDGRLACFITAGHWHTSPPTEKFPNGSRVVVCYSSDEGNTWTPPQVVYDTPEADGVAGGIQLADGRILLVVGTDILEKERPAFVAEAKVAIIESADNGKTWSEPRYPFADYSGPGLVFAFSSIRLLSDGTLLMPLYVHVDYGSPANSGAVSLSNDNGKTWSAPIVIPNGGRSLDETDVIERKDGTLYALQRDAMRFSHSKDKGKTWSVSEDVGFSGHCPHLFRTKDDVILLGMRIEPTTNLRISRDECKTWSEPIRIDDTRGAYPSMVELKDGSVLIVYYEEGGAWGSPEMTYGGGARSRIRAKKFNVTDSGVEWLPFK